MTRLLFSLLPISIFATSCATSIVPPSPTVPIYEARKIELGGVKQSVIIRGDDRSNPILMFVHGGPGFSELPTYERNADLERDFVVVQWDQRGAGKLYRPGIPKKSMAVAQFVADTHQLTDIVCRRLEKRKPCSSVFHSARSLACRPLPNPPSGITDTLASAIL